MASSKDYVRRRPTKAEKYLVAFLEDYLVEEFRNVLKYNSTVRRELYAAALDAFDDEEAFRRGLPVHDKVRHHLPVHIERFRNYPSPFRWLHQNYLVDHLEDHGRSLKHVIRSVMKCREDHAYPLDDQEILKLTEVLFPTLSDWRLTAPDGSLHAASPFVTHINLRTNWDRLSTREQRVMRLLNGIDGIDIGQIGRAHV